MIAVYTNGEIPNSVEKARHLTRHYLSPHRPSHQLHSIGAVGTHAVFASVARNSHAVLRANPLLGWSPALFDATIMPDIARRQLVMTSPATWDDELNSVHAAHRKWTSWHGSHMTCETKRIIQTFLNNTY